MAERNRRTGRKLKDNLYKHQPPTKQTHVLMALTEKLASQG
ncbi:MAG: hypothetical protein QW077_06755 [Candidatus Caldarchaeum sp.]